MRRKLAALPTDALQHFGLLIAFVLLLAASSFAAAHPGLSAALIFIFSCPYLLASVATRRAHFLYATMLLGAVSYFLVCYALGAPAAFFPLLSVPLVAALWGVGQRLKKSLAAELASFPTTVFRAMNITVAVFTGWALLQAPRLLNGPGASRYVAGATFLGFAALYLAHCVAGAAALYTYVFAAFLIAGGVLLATALSSVAFGWIPTVASAALLLFVGTRFHRDRGYGWSRHFYLSGAATIVLSLGFSALRWPYFLYDMALASLVLWVGYGWLAAAVPDVVRATSAERALAKWFFLGSMALTAPLVPLTLVLPANADVAAAALACGLLFGWIAWRRREERTGERNVYVLPASLFVSAGLLGIGRALPGGAATAWSAAVPFALLAGLGALYHALRRAGAERASRGVAEGAAFPALFAWYVPLLAGEPGVALVAAHAGFVVPLALAKRLDAKRFVYAVGPGIAGAFVSAAVRLAGAGVAACVVCAMATVAAGACFVWADLGRREIVRAAANLAWLVLSVATVVVAAGRGAGAALYSVAGVGALAVLIAGWRARRDGRDAFDVLVSVVSVVATCAAVVLGPFSGLGPAATGGCLLALSAAYGAAWGLSRGLGHARAAAGLFALGALLLVFGLLPGVEARLAVGAAAVAALFVLAALVSERFPKVSHSWAVVGHLASMALACSALILAWPAVSWGLALAALPYVALYGLMPRLRGATGFRVGAVSSLTILALFGLSAYAGTPYREQVPLVAGLSLIWLAVGYAVRARPWAAWSMPLYVSAALFAAFCGAVSLFTPAVEGSWRVFLVNGMVFAALFLLLRRDVFAYLVTLSLVLLAYDWVKASTSRFTQDVLFYLVIATAVMGVFYVLPLLKRLAARLGAVPIFSIFTWQGAVLTAVPVLCGGVLLVSVYSVKLTEHPKFCIACHNMGEYYESWQHSSHKNVACVQCHYEPGVGAELEGKMAGMIQFVKYVSHAYDNKPHALISNRSCMREGCHAGMDHSKKTLLFRGKIKFNHERHLSGHPRGKELNCVSCHGQMVEGQHISVAETTCLTCHFYGRGNGPVAAGGCRTCHPVPEKDVTFSGETFSHREFLEGKKHVRCDHCHSEVTKGDGVVTRTRCQSCHLKRTPEIEDEEKFHLVHVSEGHFDCLQCHDEIRHGKGTMSHQFLVTAHCANCHGSTRHSLQERVYAGTAIAGVEREPDVMFKAGVACDGCHTDVQDVALGGRAYKPGAKQCAECHDDQEYGDMVADWQSETQERLVALQPALAKLQKACRAVQEPNAQVRQATKLLDAARAKLACVVRDGSHGVHNYAYVSTLLDKAEEELDKSRALLNGRANRQEPGQ